MNANHSRQRRRRRIVGQSLTGGAFGAILGFLISQFINLGTFTVNLKTSRGIQMINLSLELDKEFTSTDSFRRIRMSIDGCDKLYKSWGGTFDSDQINQYLNFFDNMGFYWQLGDLDEKIIDQMFGPYIVEAYEYGEIKRYMDEAQKNTGQKQAFDKFEKLAQRIEENDDRKQMIVDARKCHQLHLQQAHGSHQALP
jgi:hypothetical protein